MGIEEEISPENKMEWNKGGVLDSKKAKRDNEALIEKINYEVVGGNGGFHQGEISHMDTCIQRPIIVTLSKTDSTIRVWNYDTGNCEII